MESGFALFLFAWWHFLTANQCPLRLKCPGLDFCDCSLDFDDEINNMPVARVVIEGATNTACLGMPVAQRFSQPAGRRIQTNAAYVLRNR